MHFDAKAKACRLSADALLSITVGTTSQNERSKEIHIASILSISDTSKYSVGSIVKTK